MLNNNTDPSIPPSLQFMLKPIDFEAWLIEKSKQEIAKGDDAFYVDQVVAYLRKLHNICDQDMTVMFASFGLIDDSLGIANKVFLKPPFTRSETTSVSIYVSIYMNAGIYLREYGQVSQMI